MMPAGPSSSYSRPVPGSGVVPGGSKGLICCNFIEDGLTTVVSIANFSGQPAAAAMGQISPSLFSRPHRDTGRWN